MLQTFFAMDAIKLYIPRLGKANFFFVAETDFYVFLFLRQCFVSFSNNMLDT